MAEENTFDANDATAQFYVGRGYEIDVSEQVTEPSSAKRGPFIFLWARAKNGEWETQAIKLDFETAQAIARSIAYYAQNRPEWEEE